MPGLAKLVIGLEILLAIAAVIAIIVLIIKRADRKNTEDFEKRDN